MFSAPGRFRYSQDINAEQLRRAQEDPNWRLEIVANLGAARKGLGQVERLPVTAAYLVGHVRTWKYRTDRVRVITPPGSDHA